MFERFDDNARAGVHDAQVEARALGHNFLGTEHLLLGVLGDTTSEASTLLCEVGVDRATLRRLILDEIGPGQSTAREPRELLATIGIDLDEVRRLAEATFG